MAALAVAIYAMLIVSWFGGDKSIGILGVDMRACLLEYIRLCGIDVSTRENSMISKTNNKSSWEPRAIFPIRRGFPGIDENSVAVFKLHIPLSHPKLC